MGKTSYTPKDITVGIVVRNGANTLPKLFDSLKNQSITPKQCIVINNASTDDTLQIIQSFKKKYGKTKIITRKVNSIAGGRNDCINACTTRLIAFTDADCIVPKTWLQSLLAGINHNNAPYLAAVGGSNTPPPTTYWNRMLGLLLNSPLGTGSSIQGRHFDKPRPVGHIPCVNVLYKKEALVFVDGFDEHFHTMIEDEDISYRMKKAGWSFFYLPNVSILHDMSQSPKHWVKKMVAYGKGRINFVIHHPETIGIKVFFPILLIGTILLSPFFILAKIGLALYYAAVFISSLYIAATTKKVSESAALLLLYPLTHIAYGYGCIMGAVQYKKNERE